MYHNFFKILFDYILSLILFWIAVPVTIPIVLLLFIINSGKIFFIQERVGKNNQVFKLIKFKTMNDRTDKAGNLLPDEERLTKIGKFVRKTSLDEIPQLINVLKGEMSLVGPRPLLVEYLPLYSKTQKMRHNAKPGITGWAQINGRNAISWQKKFELDVWYVSNISFKLDVRIIFLTIKKVLVTEGVSSSTSVTMERFTGNN